MASPHCYLIHVHGQAAIGLSWAVRQPPRPDGPRAIDLIDATGRKGTFVGDYIGPVHRLRLIRIEDWEYHAALVPIPWRDVITVNGQKTRPLGWFLYKLADRQAKKCTLSVKVDGEEVQEWINNGWGRESLLLFSSGWEFMNMNRVIELGAQDVGTLGRAYAAARFCRQKSAQFSDALCTLSGTRAATRTLASSRTIWSTAT